MKSAALKIDDWISWYNCADGRFQIGEVKQFGKRSYYPYDDFVYTDNGTVALEDVLEVRHKP